MLNRRQVLRGLAWAGAGAALAPAAACGRGSAGDARGGSPEATSGLATSPVSRAAGDPTTRDVAVRGVQAFTGDLFGRLLQAPGNLVCSPYSVALTLAMTRNGARGQTAREMDHVLHSPSLEQLDDGLSSLTQLVQSRAGSRRRADGSTASIVLDVASSLWGQRDTVWQQSFLQSLSRGFGAGIHLVDYKADAERSRLLVNQWTSQRTHGKISQLVPTGVLNDMTRLVLINAIYLKAPWEQPFGVTQTSRQPFTRADGTRVEVDMMAADLRQGQVASGPGWQAARLPYAGRQLAMALILRDPGPTDHLRDLLDGPALSRLLSSFRPVPALRLQVPRWRFRTQTGLRAPLSALGMKSAFDERTADLSAMTTQERLFVSAVVHGAMVAVDEAGTEAAAATAVVAEATSAMLPSVVLTADRPFYFVIHDIGTKTPLFVGRVSDPTATT